MEDSDFERSENYSIIQYKKAVEFLEQGMSLKDVSKLLELHTTAVRSIAVAYRQWRTANKARLSEIARYKKNEFVDFEQEI